MLTLSSVEDDGLGEELQVIWEIEPGAKIIEKGSLPEPTGFDPPNKLDAFLDAVRWGAASSAELKNIQAPFRSDDSGSPGRFDIQYSSLEAIPIPASLANFVTPMC